MSKKPSFSTFRDVKQEMQLFEVFQDNFLSKDRDNSPHNSDIYELYPNKTLANSYEFDKIKKIPNIINKLDFELYKHRKDQDMTYNSLMDGQKKMVLMNLSHEVNEIENKANSILNNEEILERSTDNNKFDIIFSDKSPGRITKNKLYQMRDISPNNCSIASDVLETKYKNGNSCLLEKYISQENNTIIPFVKRFISKLKNASALRSLEQLKNSNFSLLNDSSYFYNEIIDKEKLSNSKGLMKMTIEIKNWYFSRIYYLKKLFFIELVKRLYKTYNRVLHPYQNFKIFWDIIHLLVIIFWFFYIPLLMAFENVNHNDIPLSFYTMIFLIIDIFLNFNTSYFKNGVVERRRKKIFKNYINTKILYDIITLIPIIIDVAIDRFRNPGSYFNVFNNDRKIHFIKYVFFFKIITFGEIFNRILEKFLLKEKFQNILSLFKVFFVSVLVAHIFACFWYLTAEMSASYSKDTWISKMNLMDADWSVQYLYSIYWACITMMTVGYGDLVPQNESEIIVCIISVVLGCAVYAYNISSIGIILQDLNKENVEFTHKINIINQFMTRKAINRDLQMRIREYLRFIWKEEKTQQLEEEHKIIDLLSNSLKEELLLEAYGTILKKHTMFFANFSEKSLRKVVNIMKDIRLFPDEKVFLENEEDDSSIYFIVKGKIQLYANNNNSEIMIKELKVGDHFGEISFFTGKPRLLSARSKDFTTLFAINREEFIKVLKNHSDDFEKFCMIQDQILLYENYLPLKTRCFCCNQTGHLAQRCPLIHYFSDKEKIIKSYNYYMDQERRHYQRKITRNNALKTKNISMLSCIKIQEKAHKEKENLKKLLGSSEFSSITSTDQELLNDLENDEYEGIPENNPQKDVATKAENQDHADTQQNSFNENKNHVKDFSNYGEILNNSSGSLKNLSSPSLEEVKNDWINIIQENYRQSKKKITTEIVKRNTHTHTTLVNPMEDAKIRRNSQKATILENHEYKKNGNSTTNLQAQVYSVVNAGNNTDKMDCFEIVKNFKNYFPEYNCKMIIENINNITMIRANKKK